MPGYAKFMKDLVTKKRDVSFENDERLQHCSAISTRSLVQHKEDPRDLTIPCTIGKMIFAKALCNLGARINLMPLSIYKKLGLGVPKPTAMRLLMANRTVKKPIGVLQDILVKVGPFIFPVDFVILDCEVDFEVPIILGRPFLATGCALVEMEKGQMKFRLNKKEVTFNFEERATPIRSPAGSESQSGSSSTGSTASSADSDSYSDSPIPTSIEPASKAYEPKIWCVSGQYQL
ncbi:uncharacterized protein LOC125837397 [Solanum verrucosum]|uniref:uncharacterized protein LOC125837397 n=1 Tax=Solanum verrucosum TaxID=315347 RepID=UPI0020D1F386|nr:uncharacterized protein LOC125837397 [Solanum verrucosum]